MYQLGRPVDPVFSSTEKLYRRCTSEEVFEEKLIPAAVSFRNWSVNREKYSEPEDVVFGYDGWGAVEFPVSGIPPEIEPAQGATYQFRPDHEPLEDNYAHSAVDTYQNGVKDQDPQPSKLVKKEYRALLSEATRVCITPTMTLSEWKARLETPAPTETN